jgi:hypothetical protein
MAFKAHICESYQSYTISALTKDIQLLINAFMTFAGITVQHVQSTAVTTATPLQSV